MSSLFDRLESELEDRSKGGISPVDLLSLPDNHRRIMRAMLKATKMTRKEVLEHIGTWKEDDQISTAEIDETLADLAKQGWLITMGEAEYLGYRVNFRHKPGSRLGDSVWGALDTKIQERIDEQKRIAAEKEAAKKDEN